MDEKLKVKYVSSFVFGDGALSSLKSYSRILEDGTERKSLSGKTKNSKYYIKQLSIHEDYMNFQSEILENITSYSMSKTPSHIDKRGYTCKEQISLYSSCHPFFTRMRERFYINGVKQIDPHYLKLWDEESLCFFYMDNGWLEKKENKDGTFYIRVGLATHAYSYGDVLLIQKWIKEKFNIMFDIKRHKQKSGDYKYILRNSKDNSKKFLDKIYKYSFPSFEYKFLPDDLPLSLKGDDII